MDTSDSDIEDKPLFSKNNDEPEITDDENSGVDYEEKQGQKIYLDDETTSMKDDEESEEGEVPEEDVEAQEEGEISEEDGEIPKEGEISEEDGEIPEEDDEELEEGEISDVERDYETDNKKSNTNELLNNESIIEKQEETSDNDDSDNLDDSDDNNDYFKIDQELEKTDLLDFHPDIKQPSNEELLAACKIIRDDRGLIIDELHKTVPFVTKYEFTKVIGLRAKQLNNGADPFIDIEPDIIDGYTIALKEYEQKKIPFIIARPMPNGSKEYWKLSDLEIVHF
tara:strand:+ start:9368 stop:10213 length:846 start_codon:yes stop_codon:yes gene_type:complete